MPSSRAPSSAHVRPPTRSRVRAGLRSGSTSRLLRGRRQSRSSPPRTAPARRWSSSGTSRTAPRSPRRSRVVRSHRSPRRASRRSRCLAAADPCLERREPACVPLHPVDRVVEHGTVGRLAQPAEVLLDPLELSQRPLVPRPTTPDEREQFVPVEPAREEQAQQALVAELESVGAVRSQPLVAGALSGRGEAVFAPTDSAARRVTRSYEAGLLEPPQLGVDLPVAGAPEVAGRPVRDLLDVVAGLGADRGACRESHALSGSGLTYLVDTFYRP